MSPHLVPAITWGHNKDHRPDLKQLLYILTVSDDGGVPDSLLVSPTVNADGSEVHRLTED